jgi:CRP-like cAMP-binding protein
VTTTTERSARDLAARVRSAYESELGAVGTFLPERTPLGDLPPPFAPYADACLELGERHPAEHGGVRRWLDATFGAADPSVTAAVPGLEPAERDALMTVLCFLGHAYRWDTIPPDESRFAERRIALPAGIAEPWGELARLLEQPRVGSLWAMVLCNWSLSGVPPASPYDARALDRDGLRVRYAWVPERARAHLEPFVLTFVMLEARGAAVLEAIIEALEAAAREDVQEAAYVLDKLAAAIEAFAEPLVSTIRRPHVDPQIFIDFLQPSWAWDADDSGGLKGGPSGLQLGTLHAIDNALSIRGEGEFAAARHAALVYLPQRHRRFLETLDEAAPLLRAFVDASDDAGLKWRFNDCVRALRVFRVIHMKRGSHYLRAGAETGEGRVTTGLALEGRGDPVVAEFERLMWERVADTDGAAVAAPARGAEVPTLETALRFLTPAERELLFELGAVGRYPAGETVIAKGDRRRALYVVRAGTVLVEGGEETAPELLGVGEVFGELSFLSNEGASASVVALDELEVGVLERDRLYRLLEQLPDLAGRFYKSLAVLVANRLRVARARLGALRPEDVPARRRPPSGTLPPELRDRIDAVAQVDDEGDVVPACDELLSVVAEAGENAPSVGRYVLRRAYSLLAGSALLGDVLDGPGALQPDHRAISRMLDGNPAADGALGVAVDRWALALPFCRATRARRATLAALLREVGSAPVCNLETLPPVELADAEVTATVVSTDRDALGAAAELGATTIPANVVHVARGASVLRLPPQRLIYTSGLVDYLHERDLVRLLDWIHARLETGGVVVVGAAAADAADASFWEHVLGWTLVRRSSARLTDAFARSEFGAAHVETIADEEQGGLLAIARRAG